MVLEHILVSIAVGILSGAITYAAFNKISVSIWAFFGGFLADLPFLWLTPFGVTGLGTFMLLSHTLGIVIWPILLVILDIFLIEAQLLKYLAVALRIIHLGISNKTVETIEKADKLLDRLEEYHIIPKPIRLGRVYMVGVLSGIIHLLFNLIIGTL